MGDEATLSRDVIELVESGVTLLVGTCDRAMRSEAARAVGARVSPDRRRVTVFVPDGSGARALAHLREHPEIAVGVSRPYDNLTLQLKGPVVEVRPATEEERGHIDRYLAAHVETLSMVGLRRGLVSRFITWPAQAVTFELRDVFQQTPGPAAGNRLEAR